MLLASAPAHADVYRSLDAEAPTVLTDVPPTEGRWEQIVTDEPAPVTAMPANDGQREDSRSRAADNRANYARYIQAAAIEHNVDAALIRAVITAESGYNPSAVSRAGAVGLMQLMPETASRYNVIDSHDPEQNIHGGTRYLRDLLTLFKNDLRLTIAAYNAGEQAVMKYRNRIPPYRETLAYVPKVMKFYANLRSGRAAAAKTGHNKVATRFAKMRARTKVMPAA
ncbi:MAG TPA: transglycosylase SLT domain-containing protein [Burkholderiales bacterium]|nr:transglycosylase SLT domain-containing protein [Burkholderiales bacterium]